MPHLPFRLATALLQPFLNQTPYATFLIFIHVFRLKNNFENKNFEKLIHY